MNFSISVALLISLVTACASQNETEQVKKVSLICSEEFAQSTGAKFLDDSSTVVGGSASYLLTGVAYGVEYTARIVSGLVVGVGFCLPIGTIEYHAGGHNYEGTARCLGSTSGLAMSAYEAFPEFGDAVFEVTKEWRCPSIDKLSKGILDVAICNQRLGNRKGALLQLKALARDKTYQTCGSGEEQRRLTKLIEEMERN